MRMSFNTIISTLISHTTNISLLQNQSKQRPRESSLAYTRCGASFKLPNEDLAIPFKYDLNCCENSQLLPTSLHSLYDL